MRMDAGPTTVKLTELESTVLCADFFRCLI